MKSKNAVTSIEVSGSLQYCDGSGTKEGSCRQSPIYSCPNRRRLPIVKVSTCYQCLHIYSRIEAAGKSTNRSSLVGTEGMELRVVRRSRRTKKCDEHTVASEKASESGRSTVVTSEGRENATQRSDVEGRGAAVMTIEDLSSYKKY